MFDSAAAFAGASEAARPPTSTCSTCGCPTAAASICCGRVRQGDERTPAVMISGHGTIADAVEATQIGAFDFLEKPLARDRVLLVVKNALEWSDLQRENQRFRELVGDGAEDDRLGAGVPAGRAAGDAGGAIRRRRAAVGRIGHRQGTAGGAHPSREPVRRRVRS